MDQAEPPATGEYQLQKLSPKHKQAMALLAQGVDRATIGAAVDLAPEYITWLTRQQICKAYLKEMLGYADARLVALTEQSVDAIAEMLIGGSEDAKLKAARLQLEAVGRIGRYKVGDDDGVPKAGLEKLAERLVGLLQKTKGEVYEGQTVPDGRKPEIEDATLLAVRSANATSSNKTS